MRIRTGKTFLMGAVAASAVMLAATAADSASPMTKADAAKRMKVTSPGASASVHRLAVTSCNVLFGSETSANSSTQAGFGEPTTGRVETTVSVTYALQGFGESDMQALGVKLCDDAAARYASAGYDVVPRAEVVARPEFAALHATGKPTPYHYKRAGSVYVIVAPPGEAVIESMYLNSMDSAANVLSAIGGATSGNNAQAREGALLKALNASGLRINMMVDFAKAKGAKSGGFLGKMAGQSEAKVTTDMQVSASGFFVLSPLDAIECYAGNVCMTGTDSKKQTRLSSIEPIQGGASAITGVRDIQSKGSKAGELGANLFAGAMALGGHSTSMTKVEKNGVDVDSAAYASTVQDLTAQLVDLSIVLARP